MSKRDERRGPADTERHSPDRERREPELHPGSREYVDRTASSKGHGSDTTENPRTTDPALQTERDAADRRSGDGERSTPRAETSGGGDPQRSGSTKGGGSGKRDGNWQGGDQRKHEHGRRA
jgi:hypothetical protein